MIIKWFCIGNSLWNVKTKTLVFKKKTCCHLWFSIMVISFVSFWFCLYVFSSTSFISAIILLKFVVNKTLKTLDQTFKIKILGCSKLSLFQKNPDKIIICWHDVIINFFKVIIVFPFSGLQSAPSFMLK